MLISNGVQLFEIVSVFKIKFTVLTFSCHQIS